MRGIILTSQEIIAEGQEAVRIAEVLTASNFRILQLLSEERLDISTIADKLDLSEAYVSEQVSMLQKSKLIAVSYEPGRRGIRKICRTAISRVVLIIKR